MTEMRAECFRFDTLVLDCFLNYKRFGVLNLCSD